MEVELSALEEKIRQAAELCRRLRDENRSLKQQLSALQGEKTELRERMANARSRLEHLLKNLPD